MNEDNEDANEATPQSKPEAAKISEPSSLLDPPEEDKPDPDAAPTDVDKDSQDLINQMLMQDQMVLMQQESEELDANEAAEAQKVQAMV